MSVKRIAALDTSSHSQEAVVESGVLRDAFPEWSTLEIDGECRDLLRQRNEVDGGVEKRRLEVCFEIDGLRAAVKPGPCRLRQQMPSRPTALQLDSR